MVQKYLTKEFLKKLLKVWGRSAPEPLPKVDIDESEMISRFITSKRSFARTVGKVKYGAYIPNANGETSVFRMSGIGNDKEIWTIAEKFVRKPIVKSKGNCTIYARSETTAKEIQTSNLSIIPKPKPHPRHADIMGWSDRSLLQLQATGLANKARLFLEGSSVPETKK